MGKNQLRIRSAALIVVIGIAINVLGVKFATGLGIWLYLDSIGTVLAAVTGGILPGIIVGFASNFINGISDPITLYYGIISVLIAVAAVFLTRHGALKKLWSSLLCSIPLAIIGGGLGSILTWLLYGFNFGSGISAPLALYIYDNVGLSKALSQFSADMTLDLADKLLTMLIIFLLLRYLPEKIKSYAPRSYNLLEEEKSFFKKIGLLRNKVALMIAMTAIVLSTLSVTIGFIVYKDTMDERYKTTGNNVTSLMCRVIDGDRVKDYLENGYDADGYAATEFQLNEIRKNVSDIKYMYVYQIRQDGCHVVFDLDTDDLEGAEPGSIQAVEAEFEKYMPDLLAGKKIKPVISNGKFGWLLTVYNPIYTSAGDCAAYAAVDIDMQYVLAQRYIFIIRMISLLFAVSIVIIVFAIVYAQNRFAKPIDKLSEATERFAFNTASDRRENISMIQNLHIKTGDEIENLANSITKTVTDMSMYMNLATERNEFITRLQDNIIISFATMVENRDDATGQHIIRTAEYVRAIGEQLIRDGKYSDELTTETLKDYVKSAPLHDIGKIKITDSILNKPGKLTPEEFDVIKTHTTEGGKILNSAVNGIENNGYLRCATDMAVYHHEWWNGAGYPEGLSGTQIPLCARIMALADVFDALTTHRSYKDAFSVQKAIEIIKQESGTHFDPAVVEAFLEVLPQIKFDSDK